MVDDLTIKLEKLLLSASYECDYNDIESAGSGYSKNYEANTVGIFHHGRHYRIPETDLKDSFGRNILIHTKNNEVSVDSLHLGSGGHYSQWGYNSFQYKGFKHACLGKELKHPMNLSYKEAYELYCWYIGKREEGERDGDLLFHYHQFKEGYDIGLEVIGKHPEFLKE